MCELFIKWNGLFCPCCGYRLRTKPRNYRFKEKLRAEIEMEEGKISLSSSPALPKK
jgi:hypothetical protein